jgi:hypothetical protein
MAPWFLWLLIAVGLVAVCYFGYRMWRKSQEKEQKSNVVRKALEMHHETILLCIRCVENDVSAVVRCLAQAFATAKSPLRLRVAIVQENSVVDVYEALLKHLNKYAAMQQNYVDKIRTVNLIECEGFQQAFNSWRDLYDDEKYVLCLDPSVKLLDAWDTKVVDVADGVPDHVVCSAPGPSEFAGLRLGRLTSGTGPRSLVGGSCLMLKQRFQPLPCTIRLLFSTARTLPRFRLALTTFHSMWLTWPGATICITLELGLRPCRASCLTPSISTTSTCRTSGPRAGGANCF